MEKNKQNKIIGLSIGILVVLIIVVSSTYAYWQITRTQETPNDIVAACLNLDLEDASAAIDLDSAWPISDEEGKNLTGYTFTVTNNCDEEINYIVGLNRVEEESANYLQDSSIKLQLDDNSAFTYSDLSDVEYVDPDNTEYTARSGKQVSVESISANGTNTHTIRVWVSSDAPVSEQSKKFLGQVFITGGQGIELKECFTIADNGTLLGYDSSCGLEVKVPAEVNGIQVKEINQASLSKYDATAISLVSRDSQESKFVLLIMNPDKKDDVLDGFKADMCEDPATCDLEDMGVSVLEGLEDYNVFNWNDYVVVGQMTVNFVSETNEMDTARTEVKSLDLSGAMYLETIATGAFYMSDEKIGTLEQVILPKSEYLTSIGADAFYKNSLSEIIIPSTIVTIGSGAFANNDMTKLTFEDTSESPSRLTTIESSAFFENSFTKVVIPSSVTTIGSNAFYNSAEEIVFKRTEEDTLANVSFGNGWNHNVSKITYDPNYTE